MEGNRNSKGIKGESKKRQFPREWEGAYGAFFLQLLCWASYQLFYHASVSKQVLLLALIISYVR